MYFSTIKNFNAASGLCRSPNANIPAKINKFHQSKLRKSVQKAKRQKFSEMIKCQNKKHYKVGCGGSKN